MAKTIYNGQEVETIDMTPTWSGILNVYLNAFENGNKEGRDIAIKELRNMAKAADQYNELVKEHQKLQEEVAQLRSQLNSK